MRHCPCGSVIPNVTLYDGKRRNLRNRKKCLTCLPFGSSPYSQRDASVKKSKNAEKQRTHYRKQVSTYGAGTVNLVRKTRRKELIDHLGSACMECGYSRCIRNLSFHHLEDKLFSLQERAFSGIWAVLLLEVRKCVLLCHNCHGEVHEGILDVSRHHPTMMRLLKSFLPSERSSYKRAFLNALSRTP
jgi:hypothetical protein